MKHVVGSVSAAGSIAFALLFISLPAGAQDRSSPIWESRFDAVFAPGAEYPLQQAPGVRSSRLASAPDGDIYFYTLNQLGQPTVSRLRGSDHAVVWHRAAAMAHSTQDGRVLDARVLSDGGTLVVAGTLSRYDANGQLLWSRPLRAPYQYPTSVMEYASGDLVVVDHYGDRFNRKVRVLRMDTQTGTVLAARTFPGAALGNCWYELLASAADDALYTYSPCARAVFRLDANLSTIWQSQQELVPRGSGTSVADPTGVYLTQRLPDGTDAAVKLASEGGTVVWQGGAAWNQVRFDVAGNLLGQAGDGQNTRIVSIDAATGGLLWSSLLQAANTTVEATANAVFVAGTHPDSSTGFVARLDRNNGFVAWSTDLQAGAPGRTLLPNALLGTAQEVLVSGSDCVDGAACRIGLARLNVATGAPSLVAFPAVPQSALVAAAQDVGDDALLVSSVEAGDGGQRVRAKRFDANGFAGWERAFPVGTANGGLDRAHVAVLPGGGALVSANTVTLTYPYLAKHGPDGSMAWSRVMTEDGSSRALFAVDVGDHGDIFASVARINWLGHVGHFIEKFDASTGSKAWSLPMWVGLAVDLPEFGLVDGDFIEPTALARRSGASTAVQWSNPELRGRRVFVLDKDSGYGYLVMSDNRLAAFSLADGQARWTYQDQAPADESRAFVSAAIGPDGDVYFAGSRTTSGERTGLVLRLDRQTGALVWANRFDAPSGAPHVEAMLRHVGGGEAWITQSTPFHTFLTRLDTATGSTLDSAPLGTRPLPDDAIAAGDTRFGQRLSDGTILAYGARHEHGLRTPWAGRLIAPDSGLQGDLSLSLALTHETPDMDRLVADIVYVGSEAITGAQA